MHLTLFICSSYFFPSPLSTTLPTPQFNPMSNILSLRPHPSSVEPSSFVIIHKFSCTSESFVICECLTYKKQSKTTNPLKIIWDEKPINVNPRTFLQYIYTLPCRQDHILAIIWQLRRLRRLAFYCFSHRFYYVSLPTWPPVSLWSQDIHTYTYSVLSSING